MRKIAIEGLLFCLSQSKSVSRVKKHSGSDFCSLLPGNTNALPRIWHPKLAEHFPNHKNRHNRQDLFRNFPRLLQAIECKIAILLVYLSLFFIEIGNVSFA